MMAFTTAERNAIKKIVRAEYERLSERDKRVEDLINSSEKNEAASEEITDELLDWISRRKYSRWIVATILGLTFFAGWQVGVNYYAISLFVVEWLG